MEPSIKELVAPGLDLKPDQLAGDEKAIGLLLKKHLTKKELKAFMALQQNRSEESTAQLLKVDTDRLGEIYANALSKIRHPKIRNPLLSLPVPEEEED